MKKKLIFFAYSLDIGGIENSLVNLLDKINYKKYDVTLVLEKKTGVFLNKINENVKIIEYKVNNSKIIAYRKIYNFMKRFLWKLKNYNKYDFSCCYATYSLMGSKLSKIASRNSSIYIHSDYTNILKNENAFKDFFEIRKIDKFRKIIFVSNESKNNFCNVYSDLMEKTEVINNFIDDNRIIKLSNELICEKKTKENLFVFVGRLEEDSKKITRLLECFKYLHNNNSAELWIIGDGEDRQLYVDYVNNNNLSDVVKFLGMKSNPYPYIKISDYVILTSNYEGFPVIYLEAIVLGKKIITTIDVTDENISIPNNFGYIVSKDPYEMALEISKILNSSILKYKKIYFKIINNNKIKKLESIFDEVI